MTAYTYDAMGQLLTEKVNGVTVNVMTYDNYGNIRTKNGVEYSYCSSWKDKLTAYGDQAITYDAQGNPLNYMGHTLTWEKGRQLKSFDNIRYTYNTSGIRTSKTVDGVRHDYILDDAKIISEKWGSNEIQPLYDNEDSVCGIIYNTEPYYFFKNLQGDVIAIASRNGSVVARYSYDAWGKCTVTEDYTSVGIANINPFRYRCYYYDAETALYYVTSRYYNAVIGRWLNTDESLFFCKSNTFNCFVYCDNNAITKIDKYGFYSSEILKPENSNSWFKKGAYYLSFFFRYIGNLPRLLKALHNYMHNRQFKLSNYICGQGVPPVSKMRYGICNMSFNGCELIAVYNASKLLGKHRQLYDIAFEFESNFGQMLIGVFGTNPFTIGSYLDAHNFKYNQTKDLKTMNSMVEEGRVYIISFWNDRKNIFKGLHTVAVKCHNKSSFDVYNYYSNGISVKKFKSISDIIDDGLFICGYYIR